MLLFIHHVYGFAVAVDCVFVDAGGKVVVDVLDLVNVVSVVAVGLETV